MVFYCKKCKKTFTRCAYLIHQSDGSCGPSFKDKSSVSSSSNLFHVSIHDEHTIDKYISRLYY